MLNLPVIHFNLMAERGKPFREQKQLHQLIMLGIAVAVIVALRFYFGQ